MPLLIPTSMPRVLRYLAGVSGLIVLHLLLMLPSIYGQSVPGFNAPEKPKSTAEVSVQVKAARGEAPLSNLYAHLKVDASKIKHLPALAAREKQKEPSEKILRIGVVRTLDGPLSPLTDGSLYRIAEGNVRVMGIVSEGALYTRVHFTEMSLPAGARVFVYSMKNPDDFYGPYEGQGAAEDGTFWTPPMAGDGVVIEYFTPNGTQPAGTPFKVSAISHVFKDVSQTDAAGLCNLEVTAEWANVAKSVGMLDFVTGGFEAQCTGTLLNDQASDQIPYLLTANHCISTQTEAQSLRVYWNYNSGDDPPGGTPFTDGSNLLATGTGSDFTFVRLTGSLPEGLFFSGWDPNPVPVSTSVTGIHHPEGSHKRISFGSTNSNCLGGLPGPCANFTHVGWNSGVTEPGSSGSGIWTGSGANAQFVGTLTGGLSSCSNPTGNDEYGSFSATYPSISAFLSGTDCVSSLSPASQNFSAATGTGSFNVIAPGGCNWTASKTASFITITSGASGNGNGTVNFSVTQNSGPQRSGSIVVGQKVFNITQSGGGACAPTPISIGQTVNGNLTTNACPFGDGSFYDVYSFSATAGQQVSVLMTSTAFDTYLFLNNPDGSNLAQDDDGGGGTNSRIPAGSGFITLPTAGTYTIWANSFFSGATGPYTLTLSGLAPPTPRTLTVASSNPASGVNITVTPSDNGGLGNGTTLFTRTYNQNTTVTLTAPAIASGNNFQKWQRDGVDLTTNQSASVVMGADHTMTAVYVTPRTLTVASSNPSSGVGITVSPNDNSGLGNGTTQFTRAYSQFTTVNLTAPVTVGTSTFWKWQVDGVDYVQSQFATVTMNSDHTATAIYVTVTPTPTPTPVPGAGAQPIAFVKQGTSPNSGADIYLVNLDGTNVVNITDTQGDDLHPAWSPDGWRLAYTCRRQPDGSVNGPQRICVRNADGTGFVVLSNTLAEDYGPAWSRDGSQIAFTSFNPGFQTMVTILNADGTSRRPLNVDLLGATSPDWSADGQSIAVDYLNSIWVSRAYSYGYQRLTNATFDSRPRYSPDGSKIVFQSNRDGNTEIYVMNSNGAAQTRLTTNPAIDSNPTWSPDGTKILFTTTRDDPMKPALYVMNSDGGNPTKVTDGSEGVWRSIPAAPVIITETGTNNAAALDSVTFVRGPFRLFNPNNFSADQRTRIILFTSNLGLTQSNLSDPAILVVDVPGYNLPVENVGVLSGVPGLSGSYIVVRLPDGLPTGALQLRVRLRGVTSDASTLNISP